MPQCFGNISHTLDRYACQIDCNDCSFKRNPFEFGRQGGIVLGTGGEITVDGAIQ